MPNHNLPPTMPAPAAVALLDQEDLDEMAGHRENLAGVANQLAAMATELRRRADEADAIRRVVLGIANRVHAILAERTETTK